MSFKQTSIPAVSPDDVMQIRADIGELYAAGADGRRYSWLPLEQQARFDRLHSFGLAGLQYGPRFEEAEQMKAQAVICLTWEVNVKVDYP